MSNLDICFLLLTIRSTDLCFRGSSAYPQWTSVAPLIHGESPIYLPTALKMPALCWHILQSMFYAATSHLTALFMRLVLLFTHHYIKNSVHLLLVPNVDLQKGQFSHQYKWLIPLVGLQYIRLRLDGCFFHFFQLLQ